MSANANALTTYLWFDGQAEQAAEHYGSIFKDFRLGDVLRYSDAGPGPAGTVLTVEFEINGQKFVGLNGGPQFTFSEAVSFQIPCADQAEVDYYWERLTDGGSESQCGWLKDRFGLSWQVVPVELLALLTDPDPVKATRTTEAMYKMSKLDIGVLRDAHAGR